jgi:hypothetical protein
MCQFMGDEDPEQIIREPIYDRRQKMKLPSAERTLCKLVIIKALPSDREIDLASRLVQCKDRAALAHRRSLPGFDEGILEPLRSHNR